MDKFNTIPVELRFDVRTKQFILYYEEFGRTGYGETIEKAAEMFKNQF